MIPHAKIKLSKEALIQNYESLLKIRSLSFHKKTIRSHLKIKITLIH
jgi:hypothetical protein